MKRGFVLDLLSKIFPCLKIAYEERLEKIKKELKENYPKIIKSKENDEKIKKYNYNKE